MGRASLVTGNPGAGKSTVAAESPGNAPRFWDPPQNLGPDGRHPKVLMATTPALRSGHCAAASSAAMTPRSCMARVVSTRSCVYALRGFRHMGHHGGPPPGQRGSSTAMKPWR